MSLNVRISPMNFFIYIRVQCWIYTMLFVEHYDFASFENRVYVWVTCLISLSLRIKLIDVRHGIVSENGFGTDML